MFRVVSSKTGRVRTYPLTRSVGDAILRYLQEVRPRSPHREVFLSLRAPFRPVHMSLWSSGWQTLAIFTRVASPLRASCPTSCLRDTIAGRRPVSQGDRRSTGAHGPRQHADLCQGRSRRPPSGGRFRLGRCPMNLQRLIEQYISFQQSLGSSFTAMQKFSGLSAVPVAARASVAGVRVEHVDAFLGKARPVTRTWFSKLSCLRCFFRYAVSRGYITTAPLPTVMPKRPPAFVPYIYTREELRRLLQVIESSSAGAPPGASDDPHDDSGVLWSRLAPARGDTPDSRRRGFERVGPDDSEHEVRQDATGSRGTATEPGLGSVRPHSAEGTASRRPLFRDRRGRARRPGRSKGSSAFCAIAQASVGLKHANNRGFTTCAIRSPFTVSPPGTSRVPTCSDSCINCRSIWATPVCENTQVYLSMTPELLREASQRFERYAGKERRHD